MRRLVRSTFLVSALALVGAAGLLAQKALPPSHAATASADLAGEWHLDQIDQGTGVAVSYTTPDSSGSGLTGGVSGVELTTGRWGKALAFSNESEVRVPSPSSVLEPQTVTLLAWVKAAETPGQYRYIAAEGAHGCVASSYALYTGGSGGLVFYVDDGTSFYLSPDAGAGIWDGSWHAVAGTFDGQTVRLFVDGSEVGSGTPAATTLDYATADQSRDFTLGDYPAHNSCNTIGFSGAIDEARVYPRALTADEIAYLQTTNSPTPPELPPPVLSSTTTTTTTTSTTATSTTTSTTATTPTTPTTTTSNQTRPPAAGLSVATSKPTAGRIVAFDPGASRAGSTPIGAYEYDLDGSKRFATVCPTSAPVAYALFWTPGSHQVGLRVVGSDGRHDDTFTTVDLPQQQPSHGPIHPSGTPSSWCGAARWIGASSAEHLPPKESDVRAVGIDVTQGIVPDNRPGNSYVANGKLYDPVEQDPAANRIGVLQAGGKTIVRVYASAISAASGTTVSNVQMLLYGVRTAGGRGLLGPLLSETGPLDVSLGPPFTTHGMRVGVDSKGDALFAFTYTLPESWTHGTLRLVAEPVLVGTRSDRLCGTDECESHRDAVLDGIQFRNTGVVEVRALAIAAPGDPDPTSPPAALDAVVSISPIEFVVPTHYRTRIDIPYLGLCKSNPRYGPCSDPNRDTMNNLVLGYVQRWVADPANALVGARYVKSVTIGIHSGYSQIARGVENGPAYTGCPYTGASILCETNDSVPYAQSDTDRALGIAHELYHELGRPHADDNKSCIPISGFSGTGEGKPDPEGQIEGIGLDRHAGSGGALSTPYKLISPDIPKEATAWYDFLSYCTRGDSNAWISAYNWNTVASDFASWSENHRYSTSLRSPSATGIAAGPALMVTGYRDASGAHITSVEPVQGGGTAPAHSAVTAVVRGGAGQVVGSVPLYASMGHADPEGKLRSSPILVFSGTVPARGASRLQIELDGSTIATQVRSVHAPTVKLRAPLEGTIGRSRTITIRWRATDRDGGTLTGVVDYSTDGGRSWHSVYDGPGAGHGIALPSTYFAGSADARIRVRVSDGFNQTTVVSGRLRAVGSPPTIRITSPRQHDRFQSDSSVYLNAQAFDDASRLLEGSHIRWYAGRRLLGVGPTISTTLAPGHMLVRAVARDANGRSGSATVPIVVTPARPFFTKLLAPTRISKTARTVRLIVATNVAATLRVGGHRVTVGRQARSVVVRVHPGRRSLRLSLALTSGGLRSTGVVVVDRP